jgi:hypothetical protein
MDNGLDTRSSHVIVIATDTGQKLVLLQKALDETPIASQPQVFGTFGLMLELAHAGTGYVNLDTRASPTKQATTALSAPSTVASGAHLARLRTLTGEEGKRGVAWQMFVGQVRNG